jgi:proline dehydrogenase
MYKANQLIDFKDTKTAFEHYNLKKLKRTYLIFSLMNQKTLVKIGTFFIKISLRVGFPIKKLIKNTIFDHFCGGEDINDCEKTISILHQYGVGTILDYSVEGEEEESVFEATKEEIIKTIVFAQNNRKRVPFSVFKVSGIGPFELLAKVQEGMENLNEEEKEQFEKVKKRIYQISKVAADGNVKLFFDAEETWIQNPIDSLCKEMMQTFNRAGRVIIYNTYQLYRTDSLEILKQHLEIAKAEGFLIGAKLVRGAYMEKERKRAISMGMKDPIHISKTATDEAFDDAVAFCINHIADIHFCLGTHNEASCLKCIEQMTKKGLDIGDERVYFAQLLGMSDNISFNLAKVGIHVAKYVPYGPIKAVMPYLFRRAEENTAMAGQTSREFSQIAKELKRRRKEL